MKKLIVIFVLSVLLLSTLVSASWFSDIWKRISGELVSSPERECEDTDEGMNITFKGTVFYSYSKIEKEYEDECIVAGTKVKEYYCDSNNRVRIRTFECQGYCDEGACIELDFSLEGLSCYDRDGEDKFERGQTFNIVYNDRKGYFITRAYEYYCNRNKVYEYICDKGKVRKKIFVCEQCENGACVIFVNSTA